MDGTDEMLTTNQGVGIVDDQNSAKAGNPAFPRSSAPEAQLIRRATCAASPSSSTPKLAAAGIVQALSLHRHWDRPDVDSLPA